MGGCTIAGMDECSKKGPLLALRPSVSLPLVLSVFPVTPELNQLTP
jgi:hypothetical protein